MTPEDVVAVQRSWSEFSRMRGQIRTTLARCFEAVSPSPADAVQRSDWLFAAVEDLIGLLSAPSLLATRARDLGERWPDSRTAPSFAIEGTAWMCAADECVAIWSDELERSWRQAWLLLSEVLAAETLAPFTRSPSPAPDITTPRPPAG